MISISISLALWVIFILMVIYFMIEDLNYWYKRCQFYEGLSQKGKISMKETPVVSAPKSREEYIAQCKTDAAAYLKQYRPVLRYLCNKDLVGVSYPSRENNTKVGVLTAFKTASGNIYIGVSKSHSTKEKFNKYIGVVKSFKKLQHLSNFDMAKVHPSARAAVQLFLERVKKYYKVEA